MQGSSSSEHEARAQTAFAIATGHVLVRGDVHDALCALTAGRLPRSGYAGRGAASAVRVAFFVVDSGAARILAAETVRMLGDPELARVYSDRITYGFPRSLLPEGSALGPGAAFQAQKRFYSDLAAMYGCSPAAGPGASRDMRAALTHHIYHHLVQARCIGGGGLPPYAQLHGLDHMVFCHFFVDTVQGCTHLPTSTRLDTRALSSALGVPDASRSLHPCLFCYDDILLECDVFGDVDVDAITDVRCMECESSTTLASLAQACASGSEGGTSIPCHSCQSVLCEYACDKCKIACRRMYSPIRHCVICRTCYLDTLNSSHAHRCGRKYGLCAICQQSLDGPLTQLVIPPCNERHAVHVDCCLKQILTKNCDCPYKCGSILGQRFPPEPNETAE